MEKVLIHDDENYEEDIHYIKGSFLEASKTLCGRHLYSISTTHIRKLDVTCKECLEIMKKTSRKHIKELDYDSRWSPIIIIKKINELVKIVNDLSI